MLLQTHLWPRSSAPFWRTGLGVAGLDLGRRDYRAEGVRHHLLPLVSYLPHAAQCPGLLTATTWPTASTPVSWCPTVPREQRRFKKTWKVCLSHCSNTEIEFYLIASYFSAIQQSCLTELHIPSSRPYNIIETDNPTLCFSQVHEWERKTSFLPINLNYPLKYKLSSHQTSLKSSYCCAS